MSDQDETHRPPMTLAQLIFGKSKSTQQVPPNMTGGVDLTGTPDLLARPDSLDRLNRQPEVIQTLTGGHGPLYGSVSGLEPDPDDPAYHMSKELQEAFNEIATDADGKPVRMINATRGRTMRYTLSAGMAFDIAGRDSRRTSLIISVFSLTPGTTNYLYVGEDRTQAALIGFRLGTVAGVPYAIELNHTDKVAIAADAANANNVDVSIQYEFLEG